MKAWISGVALLVLAAPASAQEVPDLLRRYGTSDSDALFEIKSAAVRGTEFAVLTSPAPAIHLFGPRGLTRAWARSGRGPAELVSPVDIAWADAGVFVLDANQRKIVTYSSEGVFEASRSLDDLVANRLFVVGGDTILGAFAPMSPERTVLRIRGTRRDTLLAFLARGDEIRLVAEGSPNLTVRAPFIPQFIWTALPTGGLAVWNPDDQLVRLYDRSGEVVRRLGPIREVSRVTAADREHWYSSAIPSDFAGQRIFEPVRRRAREVIRFPDRLPAVLSMRSDPKGHVWIAKSTRQRGELWEMLDEAGGSRGRVRFGPGRELLRVGPTSFVVLAVDDLGLEVVEEYALPGWAQ